MTRSPASALFVAVAEVGLELGECNDVFGSTSSALGYDDVPQ